MSAIRNYARCSLSALRKSEKAYGLPVAITIEPTNVCNLHCPVCETGAGILKRPKGYMTLEQFKTILDNLGEQVNQLLLYFMGETFLNKEAYAMIAEARSRGIFVSVCTNGDFVDGHRLVESGVNEVSFQIGGITQKTHEVYRQGSNLVRVVENIREAWSSKYYDHHDNVGLRAGLIVMKHNEHEVPKFKDWCRSAGIGSELISPCVRNVEQAAQFLPSGQRYQIYDQSALKQGILRPKVVPHNRCWWIYYSTVICWNGDVVPCCRDAQGDYVMGNALQQDFREIWNGRMYRLFRQAIATEQNQVGLCRLCSGYGVPRLKHG